MLLTNQPSVWYISYLEQISLFVNFAPFSLLLSALVRWFSRCLISFAISLDPPPPVLRHLGLKAPCPVCHLQLQFPTPRKTPKRALTRTRTHVHTCTHTHTHTHLYTLIQISLIQTTNVVTASSLVNGSSWVYCGVLRARQSKTKQYATKRIFQVKQ